MIRRNFHVAVVYVLRSSINIKPGSHGAWLVARRVAWYCAVLFTSRGIGVARRGSYLSENCRFLVPESKETICARCSARGVGSTRVPTAHVYFHFYFTFFPNILFIYFQKTWSGQMN
jgi:hypothetical protein